MGLCYWHGEIKRYEPSKEFLELVECEIRGEITADDMRRYLFGEWIFNIET